MMCIVCDQTAALLNIYISSCDEFISANRGSSEEIQSTKGSKIAYINALKAIDHYRMMENENAIN
jgi:hypothetical protein